MLVVCDFAGIEARVLAWLARDEQAIEVFRTYDAGTGPDPYRVMAGVIFGITPNDITKDQRQIGKIAELGLGYGMGVTKFEALAGRDKLTEAGVSARKVVAAYRRRRAPVVQYWSALQNSWLHATHPFAEYDDGTLRLQLPSGREIVYRDADRESYIGRGNRRTRVYGGLLAENIVQATSRDLLADALVRAEDAGLNPVLHCHDEIVCDVPASEADAALRALEEIMHERTAPAWAEGCPISCEGFVSERYRK